MSMAEKFESDDALLSELRRRLTIDGAPCFELWFIDGPLMAALETPEFLERNALSMAALFIETMPKLDHPNARRSVEAALYKAVSHPIFFKTFAGALVKQGMHVRGRIQSYCVVKWAVLLLKRLPLPENQKPVSKLISMTGRCLDHLTGKALRKSVARFKTLATQSASFRSELQSIALDMDSASLLLLVCETIGSGEDAVREKYLSSYCTHILASKKAPLTLTVSAFQPLMASLKKKEFEKTVLPALTRSLRRNPDVVLNLAVELFGGMNLDVSVFGMELQKVIMQFIRHTNSDIQHSAILVYENMTKLISDRDVIQHMADALEAILSGKAEGKIKNIHERVALAQALGVMSATPARNHDVSCHILSAAQRLYKSEVNDEMKCDLLKTAGCWLISYESLSESTIEILLSGLNGKEPVRNAALNALARCHENGSLFLDATALVSVLCKIVENGLNKLHSRAEGLTSFLILSDITAADPRADSIIKKAGIWEKALAPSSAFFDLATITKLPETSCIYLISLCQVLLLQHVERVDGKEGCLEMISGVLVLMCLHGAKSVRMAAFRSVGRCIEASSSLLSQFLDGFRIWLEHDHDSSIFIGTTGEADQRMAVRETRDRYREALAHLVPFGVEANAESVATILVMAHHPMLQSAKDPGWMWKRICKTNSDFLSTLKSPPPYPKTNSRLIDLLIGELVQIVPLLLEEKGIDYNHEKQKKAALDSITTCARSFAPSLFPVLLPFIRHLLEMNEVEAMTEKEVFIFRTPEGKLSTELQDTVVIIQDTKKKQKKKKPKRRYRTDKVAFAEQSESSEEEEEEPQKTHPPMETAIKNQNKTKKPGHLNAAERQMAYREKQLAEESEIRKRVTIVQKRLEMGLRLIEAFVKGDVSFSTSQMEEFSELVQPLLTSELVGEGAACEAFVSLSKCLPPPLDRIPLDVAVALRLVALYDAGRVETSYDELLAHPSLVAVMNGLKSVEAQGNGAFYLLLPILRIALHSNRSPFFDAALEVLSDHCVPGERLPKTQTLDLLYDTLSKSAVNKNVVVEALKQLCVDVFGYEIFSVLKGLLYPSSVVRSATLEALLAVPSLSTGTQADDDRIASYLLLAHHDMDERNCARAQQLMESIGVTTTASQLETLAPLVGYETADIRQAAVGALVFFLQSQQQATQKLIDFVISAISGERSKVWFLGGALLFEKCSRLFAARQIETVLEFVLTEGMTHADDDVRDQMVPVGLALVDAYDPRSIDALFQLLDRKLAETKAKGRGQALDDHMREGAIVLLGSVAKQLNATDPKLKDIIGNLLDVLSTPSEAVQRAASVCLSPLMSKCQSDTRYTSEIIEQLMEQVAAGESYGHRRGAAFGIAGAVKGLGTSSLKTYGIMDKLNGYVEDKSKAAIREGGISAYDCLSERLGKLFDPYIIHILPLLLTCFGDTAVSVRQATASASKTIMHNLSGQGVKLVLPPLLKGLQDKAWRTKQGSIQLLSAMAWCAPKQLSTCLPMIVPQLITVLADPHPKVHAAAEHALEEVGSTIRNPEVQQLVRDILNAIAYPAHHTVACLDKLLESKFQNTIDPPSLAFVVPVVHYGLKDRSGENKKRAARIVQNLCKLVNDPKDMNPYINILLPELKKGIVDTLPDVRAQAAKALGGLVFDMGKQALEEVMPWLLEMLESNSSAVERSGAAQATSEVLAVFSDEYFESILPKILANCSSSMATLREGGVAVLRYLPYSMADRFQEKLDVVLPFILDGLADENESVRDISLAAGRTLVDVYAQTSLSVILPAVEQSLFHGNWRIRQSSVELLGNLIFKVAGTSGKVKLDGGSDDEGPATQSYEKNLIRALGLQRRNAVLAKLYMSRSDVQHPVRVAALHIWKTVVMNTPKALTEMLSALMDLIIEMLAFGEEDGRQTSARCLGELVKKMGDRFLPKIVPIMQQCFTSEDSEKREGVCYGLKELLESLSSGQLAEYLPALLPTIQSTLCDEDSAVREAAATAFDALFKAGASSVVESVIPDILHKLEDEKQSDKALEGLRVILSIRPHTFENMLPKLLKEPLTIRRLKAIAALSEVASGGLRSHLTHLMQSLMTHGSKHPETELVLAAQEAAKKVVISLPEEHLRQVMTELKRGMDDNGLRLCAAQLISTIAESRPISDHVESLLQSLVTLMNEEHPIVLKTCWTALKSVAATVPKELRATHIRVLTDAVTTATERAKRKDLVTVAGFCLPEGIGPILPFYIEGVQAASGELRESSATGLGELVEVTDAIALKSYVGLIMGPLIRIINDRFPWNVKLAILHTMGVLICKAGDEMRKFVAALQPIFLKCLPDPTVAIRDSAAKNLGHLTRLSPRIDPLINNLATFAIKTESPMRNAYLSAMAEAFVVGGEKISPPILQKTGGVLLDLLSTLDDNDNNAIALGISLGSFCKHCDVAFTTELLDTRLNENPPSRTQKLMDCVLMATISKHCPSKVIEANALELFKQSLTRFARDDSIPIKKASCRASSRLLESDIKQELLEVAVPVIITCLSPDQSTELQDEALKSVQLISYKDANLLKDWLKEVVPLVCALAREASGPKKLSCETALALLLDLSDGFMSVHAFLVDNPGATAKALLVEPYLRRIQRFTRPTEYEDESY